MGRSGKEIQIGVLDDSAFYTALVTYQLKDYSRKLFGQGAELNIRSYTSTKNFVRDLKKPMDIAFVDYHLDGANGSEIVRRIKLKHPECSIIIISHEESIQTAIKTLLIGASGFLPKDHLFTKRLVVCIDDLLQNGNRC